MSRALQREPFFIVGPPRSGTTLLERLLSRHSRIFVSPETEFFFLLDRQGLLDRPYDSTAMDRFLGFYLTQRPARLLGLHEVDDLRERLLRGAESYAEVFRRLLELVGAPEGKPVCGEKTPHHLRSIDYILDAFPGTRVIGLIRDGRAVVKSRLKHPHWEHNLLDASRRWAADAIRLQVASCREKERLLLISYENLVADPASVLGQVCNFLGEVFEPAQIDEEAAAPGRFQAYYQQPWMQRSLSGIDASRADSWKSSYSPAELAVVEHEAGRELDRFGYPRLAADAAGWQGLWLREWLRHQRYRLRMRLAR